MGVLPQAWMAACNLPQAWRGQDSWRVLDTAFGNGSRLLALWQTWLQDARSPSALHVVAICPQAPPIDALLRQLAAVPALRQQARALERQWFGFLPGFHRIELHGARLRLTLCVGTLHAMLREQQFEADSVFLGAPPGAEPALQWDQRGIKAVTRLCRRGSGIAIAGECAVADDVLQQAGIVATHGPDVQAGLRACQYQPHWTIATSRSSWRRAPGGAGDCVVVGAGLAGAAMAYALARRGWQVTVLDRAAEPAASASALPVGLLAPQVSRDDNLRSQLARAGIRMALQSAIRMLEQGRDWCWNGVAELAPQWQTALPKTWPQAGQQWSRAGFADAPARHWRLGAGACDGGIWHASAGWIKPARLVQAWLSHPGIRFAGQQTVHTIAHQAAGWCALDRGGAVLAQAQHLVLACAGDAVALIDRLTPAMSGRTCHMPLSPVDGQVSWAVHSPGDQGLFPRFAVNGAGAAIAHVPQTRDTTAWFVGVTYETATEAPIGTQLAQMQNHDRLAQLLPDAARALAPGFAHGAVQSWRGTRWTTPDRLPLAGALLGATWPGLWISAGLGSRGLTYAMLCAESIAARIGAEPSPVEARLLRRIDPTRFASNQL